MYAADSIEAIGDILQRGLIEMRVEPAILWEWLKTLCLTPASAQTLQLLPRAGKS